MNQNGVVGLPVELQLPSVVRSLRFHVLVYLIAIIFAV
jgi:hypothetical protein